MTTITITLPDELAKQAKAKGLLSTMALVRIIDDAVKNGEPIAPESPAAYPSDMDPRLKGAVNPLAFKRGKIIGDVVNPLDYSRNCRSFGSSGNAWRPGRPFDNRYDNGAWLSVSHG